MEINSPIALLYWFTILGHLTLIFSFLLRLNLSFSTTRCDDRNVDNKWTGLLSNHFIAVTVSPSTLAFHSSKVPLPIDCISLSVVNFKPGSLLVWTVPQDQIFSTLKRIKTFLRNTMDQERLSALAMLSIEKDFITKIADFNNKVIEKFAHAKERRKDFLFK